MKIDIMKNYDGVDYNDYLFEQALRALENEQEKEQSKKEKETK